MAGPPFTLSFALSFEDYLALGRARARFGLVGRYGRWGRYAVWTAIFLAVLAGLAWWDDTPLSAFLDWRVAPWFLVLPACLLLIDLIVEQGLYRLTFRRLAGANQTVTLTAEEAGLSWTLGAMTGRTEWRAFTARVVAEDRLFLFISRLEAFTLARRGLEGGDWDAFLAFIRDRTGAVVER